jgi:CubicO group peptidase (beta-lactamase class C family)
VSKASAGLVGLALVALCAHAALAQRPDSAAQAVDRVFDRWNRADSPGCAVGVSRAGAVLLERGYGSANLETNTPITPTSIFHVASIAKQFTAMAILLLQRDGKLSLDDDIRRYVPELPDYGSPITIRQLLGHVSGLRDHLELIYLARGRFEEDRISEADVLDVIEHQSALNFKPGTESLYENSGYSLLSLVVKRITGESIRSFAGRRLFQPLGMRNTHFHDDYTMIVPGRTSAYEPRPGPDGPWRVSVPNYDLTGFTSLFSTVDDLLKWSANFRRPTIGDSAMFALMETPVTLLNGDTTEYGLGLRRMRTYRGVRVVETTGSDPGYQGYIGRYPDEDIAIVVLCNAGSAANPTALAHGVADVLLSHPDPVGAKAVSQAGVIISREHLQRRVGVYWEPATLSIVRLSMKGERLLGDGSLGGELIPLSDDRFALSGQGGDIIFSDQPRAGFQRRVPGRRPQFFERREPVAATSQLLAQYASNYVSPELGGVVFRVLADDSTLAIRRGTAQPLIAQPVFADTFVANGYTIQFTRDGGRIVGFEVTNPRMRRVRFSRLP